MHEIECLLTSALHVGFVTGASSNGGQVNSWPIAFFTRSSAIPGVICESLHSDGDAAGYHAARFVPACLT